jgi:hypothetical protein
MIRATLLFFFGTLAGQGVCLRKKPWKRGITSVVKLRR